MLGVQATCCWYCRKVQAFVPPVGRCMKRPPECRYGSDPIGGETPVAGPGFATVRWVHGTILRRARQPTPVMSDEVDQAVVIGKPRIGVLRPSGGGRAGPG